MAPDTISTIANNDARFPALLRQIADPPKQLYCRGNTALLNSFSVGVVGTRKASDYGKQACGDIVSTLASSGITIVSGLALGIDAHAHRTTLNNHGATIAVLGSGVDDATIGPRENFQLARDILASNGLIISEYPQKYPADKWTFPARNRIISGISRGVLIVEADRQSGSLITAKCALDQDRDVFAVPGSIYWPRSIGANLLIQQGARPVMTAYDILECYQMRQDPLPEQAVSTSDPVQKCILTLLQENGPMQLDAIAASAKFDTPRVIGAIALLELRGDISHQGAGIYKLS